MSVDLAGPHHNHPPEEARAPLAADRLRSIIERIERLNDERKALSSDIRDIFLEAKSAGFNPKVLRALISIRAKDAEEVEAEETELDTYRRALGM